MRETDMLVQRRLDSLSRLRPTTIGGTPGGMDVLVNDLRVMFPNLDTLRISVKGPDNTPGIAIKWKARKLENVMNENRIVEYVKQKMGYDKLILLKGIYLDSIPSVKDKPAPPKPEVKKPKR
jgi:hypothetical protein